MTDFLKETSALCIGLVACSLGVGGAGLAATTAAGELAVTAVGRLREMGADRRRVAAAQATVRTDWAARAREDPDIARMEDFLALNAGGVPIEREIFRGLLKSGKYETAATDHLLALLGIVDIGLSEQAQAYARALLQSGVASAMEGKAFLERLDLDGMLALLEGTAETHAKLDALSEQIRNDVPRSLLENLALRFEHDNPDAPVAELEGHLKDKAVEWKALKARLAALEATDARVANIRAAAEAALAAGDFDTARARLDDALRLRAEGEALPVLRKLSEVHALKAETYLLQGDADQAAAAFETGARLFSGIDRLQEARTRHAAALRLYEHGLRYGSTGLLQAIALHRANDAIVTRADHPVAWAGTQNNLAAALANQAARTEGAAGTDLLAEAVAAYRAALEVRTRADHPVAWAMTQNNLAIALTNQAARTKGAAGTDLLAEAVSAYRAALEVRTRANHPVDWAMTQNNLANALADQAAHTKGAAGTDLLAEAVTAYRAALEVYTRADHPVAWAMTQENLGLAFEAMAGRATGDPGARYAKALACFDGALEVFDLERMAPSHAKCRRNRDRVAAKLAALGPPEGSLGPKPE